MQHAAVIERYHIAGHHFVLNLIGGVSEHSANGKIGFVQLNGLLW